MSYLIKAKVELLFRIPGEEDPKFEYKSLTSRLKQVHQLALETVEKGISIENIEDIDLKVEVEADYE